MSVIREQRPTVSAAPRLAPWSGVVAATLWVAAVVLLDTSEAAVLGEAEQASGAQLAAYLSAEASTIYLGTSLFALGTVAFVWFLGVLHEQLGRAGAGLGSWAYGCGVLAAGAVFGMFALRLAATQAVDLRPGGLPDAALDALYVGMDGFFLMAVFALGGCYLAAGWRRCGPGSSRGGWAGCPSCSA